jgi:hypothetical protein
MAWLFPKVMTSISRAGLRFQAAGHFPHGSIGTAVTAFFGEPSMILSE